MREETGCRQVLMVSTSFPANIRDWRGLFIRHLVDALGRRTDLNLRLWAPPGECHPAVTFDLRASERRWLAQVMQAGGIAHLYRQGPLVAATAIAKLLVYLHRLYRRNTAIDVYHINWLQNALPVPPDGRPLLISVLGTDLKLLQLPMMVPLLRQVFRGRRVAVCPNSDWMVAPLQEAFGDIAQVRFVPFGVDPQWYEANRRIDDGPARWLAVTRLTRAKLGSLFEASAPFFRAEGRELHLIGPMQEEVPIPDWVHYHGPLGPDILRTNFFPGAKGLITLSSHAEGRPQVMLEAMAAGLPVIASNISAHASFVQHRETGWLHRPDEALERALLELEDAATNARMSAAARAWAKREVGTWDDCAARYVAVYDDLMRDSAGA